MPDLPEKSALPHHCHDGRDAWEEMARGRSRDDLRPAGPQIRSIGLGGLTPSGVTCGGPPLKRSVGM